MHPWCSRTSILLILSNGSLPTRGRLAARIMASETSTQWSNTLAWRSLKKMMRKMRLLFSKVSKEILEDLTMRMWYRHSKILCTLRYWETFKASTRVCWSRTTWANLILDIQWLLQITKKVRCSSSKTSVRLMSAPTRYSMEVISQRTWMKTRPTSWSMRSSSRWRVVIFASSWT